MADKVKSCRAIDRGWFGDWFVCVSSCDACGAR